MSPPSPPHKRRILFVDDEPRVLDGLENVLFSHAREWLCDFAEGGVEALELMAKHRYDILVTDIRMPGMDGATLLARAQKAHPAVARIVLSGHCELEAAMRALPLAHQLLGKPCEPAMLIGALQRAFEVQTLVSDPDVRALLGRISRLPIRPSIYNQLVQLLGSETASLDDVADLVARDVGISSHLLHIANTAFFSRGQTTTSLRQVVTRLGGKLVRELTLAAEVMGPLGRQLSGLSLDEEQQHAIACAELAADLVEAPDLRDDAFLAGLLHDAGKLALAGAEGRTYQQVLNEAKLGPLSLHEVEVERFGVTHADVGAYLLGLWGMSHTVTTAVGMHHRCASTLADGPAKAVATAVAHANRRLREDDAHSHEVLDCASPEQREGHPCPRTATPKGRG